MRITRRHFIKLSLGSGAALFWACPNGTSKSEVLPAPDLLDGESIDKYAAPLVIPPSMPRTRKLRVRGGKNIDYYEIAVRQFSQQILPPDLPATTVWSYGSKNHPGTFHYPAFTLEAKWEAPVRVKWINELVDSDGDYLPHLLTVDQTLHWANPPGGLMHRDHEGHDPEPYTGPVPIVTHVHGAHTTEESDGYSEAWYLPDANNIPSGYAREGTWYATFKSEFESAWEQEWTPGSAVFQYPNDQRAATLWYHDHSLGITRLNVYAGPAGFYLLRGGPSDDVAGLPGPAPAHGDKPGTRYYEIPIAIQDRSFKEDGSLFYPDHRAFFEGLSPTDFENFPFIPSEACDGMTSDVSKIWNPEFFGNTMVVNGRTWPVLTVEPRRYRFRFLNGCNSRFLILKLASDPLAECPAAPALPFWQIGTEGGFLPTPVMLDSLLMAPAERADVIVDFTGLPEGASLFLINEAPDEPFGGGEVETDFEPAHPETTGQVMKFVVGALHGADKSLQPDELVLPAIVPLGEPSLTRAVSLNELESQTVRVLSEEDEAWTLPVVLACGNPDAVPFGPVQALCGTLNPDLTPNPLKWMHPITENPALGATELWEIHNFTMDAHPIHLHQVMFQVVDRMNMMSGAVRAPEPWESGWKDTVIAYPDEVTRIKARFDLEGLYVWHCHIVEHEDNEMMRPYYVGTIVSKRLK